MINEITNVWRLIDPKAPVIELRAIGNGRTQSLLFPLSDFESSEARQREFERVAHNLNTAGMNIYVVMNTIREDFCSGSVKDTDIEHRDWLLIDIDRAESAKCPAADEEIRAAEDLADQVVEFMTRKGWSEPLRIMSGNGCHLYYRLNALENDDQSKVLLKSLISGLGDKFDNNVVKIDRSVFNASRITKVVGTKAYKGQDSIDRPYRMARLKSC
jgi:hypothetical protein